MVWALAWLVLTQIPHAQVTDSTDDGSTLALKPKSETESTGGSTKCTAKFKIRIYTILSHGNKTFHNSHFN